MGRFVATTLLATAACFGCGGEGPGPEDEPPSSGSEIPVARIEAAPAQDSVQPHSIPRADPGHFQEIRLGEVAHLDGRASTDDDGDPLSFLWSLEQRPVLSQLELGEDAPIAVEGEGLASFLPDRVGTFGVGLVVHDGESASEQAFALIRVMSPPEGPIAVCTTSTNARVGQPVVFDASSSQNPIPHVAPLEFAWEPARLPEASHCLGSVSAIDEPTLSFVPDVVGRYGFVVQVSAAGVQSEVLYVEVTVGL